VASGNWKNDVDKVPEEATAIAPKALLSLIDGPCNSDCGHYGKSSQLQKAAKTVKLPAKPPCFIFPDLNTATTHTNGSASADVVSIGPSLQSIRKPVNDLSRGRPWLMISSTPLPNYGDSSRKT